MEYDPYEILGLTSSATEEETDERYRQLRDRYSRDRFLSGDAGEEAAENLERLEVAYRDILNLRGEKGEEHFFSPYDKVQSLLRDKKTEEAQSVLDECESRDAEWHYLQSIVFYQKSWYLESKKQLEYALQMEPNNAKYSDSLDKLKKILASDSVSPDKLRTTARPTSEEPAGTYGDGSCTGNACMDCLLCNACCNCLTCSSGC